MGEWTGGRTAMVLSVLPNDDLAPVRTESLDLV